MADFCSHTVHITEFLTTYFGRPLWATAIIFVMLTWSSYHTSTGFVFGVVVEVTPLDDSWLFHIGRALELGFSKNARVEVFLPWLDCILMLVVFCMQDPLISWHGLATDT